MLAAAGGRSAGNRRWAGVGICFYIQVELRRAARSAGGRRVSRKWSPLESNPGAALPPVCCQIDARPAAARPVAVTSIRPAFLSPLQQRLSVALPAIWFLVLPSSHRCTSIRALPPARSRPERVFPSVCPSHHGARRMGIRHHHRHCSIDTTVQLDHYSIHQLCTTMHPACM